MTDIQLNKTLDEYVANTKKMLDCIDKDAIHTLCEAMLDCWKEGRQIFVCGNGGSNANAIHIANDLIYGIAKSTSKGMRCHALGANNAVITCLANDEGYDSVFSLQLKALANQGDILLVLSGSGNSSNIVEVIRVAKEMNVKSFGILGFSGGKAKTQLDCPIHFPIDDMQISEDMQMIVVHMLSQYFLALHKQGEYGV